MWGVSMLGHQVQRDEKGAGSGVCSNLLVDIQFPENLSGIEKMGVVEDPEESRVSHVRFPCAYNRPSPGFRVSLPPRTATMNILLDIPGKQRQIQDQRQPVAVDKEHED